MLGIISHKAVCLQKQSSLACTLPPSGLSDLGAWYVVVLNHFHFKSSFIEMRVTDVTNQPPYMHVNVLKYIYVANNLCIVAHFFFPLTILLSFLPGMEFIVLVMLVNAVPYWATTLAPLSVIF